MGASAACERRGARFSGPCAPQVACWAHPLLISLDALLLGAEQSSKGAAFAHVDLPDVAKFTRIRREMDLVRDAAPWIVAGTRAR